MDLINQHFLTLFAVTVHIKYNNVNNRSSKKSPAK